jgi:hypothetical protein
MRAVLSYETVLDSRRGIVLWETGAAFRRVPGSSVDVRLADVALVGLFQVGRARRLHVVTDRPELELAEVQRFLLRGVRLQAARLRRDVAGLSTWRSASCTARQMVMFSARLPIADES